MNVLGSADDELALLFARRDEDRFGQVEWTSSRGLPRLDGAAGWAVCDLGRSSRAGTTCSSSAWSPTPSPPSGPPLVYGHRTFGTHSRFAERPASPSSTHITACAH